MVQETVITFDKETNKMLTQSNRVTDCNLENLIVTTSFIGEDEEEGFGKDIVTILEKQDNVVIIKRETKDFIRYTTLIRV